MKLKKVTKSKIIRKKGISYNKPLSLHYLGMEKLLNIVLHK